MNHDYSSYCFKKGCSSNLYAFNLSSGFFRTNASMKSLALGPIFSGKDILSRSTFRIFCIVIFLSLCSKGTLFVNSSYARTPELFETYQCTTDQQSHRTLFFAEFQVEHNQMFRNRFSLYPEP